MKEGPYRCLEDWQTGFLQSKRLEYRHRVKGKYDPFRQKDRTPHTYAAGYSRLDGRGWVISNLRRIEGSTLSDAWISLSPSQRVSVIRNVAMYCDLLAKNMSPILRSVTGKPVLEPYRIVSDSELLGPFTHEECMGHVSAPSADCSMLRGDFHFYHPDLGPGNIIVSDDGNIVGILHWESAGYYPDFWIATKPSVSPDLDFLSLSSKL